MSEEIKQTRPSNTDAPTILWVEEDILVRMLVAEYLRRCGYRVIEGVSAEEVLVVLRAGNTVQILLVGFRIGGERDGFELASTVRESYPEVDIIMTSGVQNAASKAGDLCDRGPVHKPFHPQELLRRINLLRANRRPPPR
jgi:DNA-binding response OmpR family regulator